ncbi:hypothetical protein D623_10012550 [Myotis brandtii]|uniref:Disks large homologue 1 N-terminal PEST domain-containing protein n=1 Tax=Myotis brandtii TaxID=109478 RepID=S7NNL9_MYOBR|nr:hypothetical protein D623_10012550 [Myotis brandtii]
MQRPSASRAENYQLLWDTIASLKQCEQAMQHAFIPASPAPIIVNTDTLDTIPYELWVMRLLWAQGQVSAHPLHLCLAPPAKAPNALSAGSPVPTAASPMR